jgi:hypothetical protein
MPEKYSTRLTNMLRGSRRMNTNLTMSSPLPAKMTSIALSGWLVLVEKRS